QRGLHGGLRVHVQGGQRVVQHQELGPADHRAAPGPSGPRAGPRTGRARRPSVAGRQSND
ncbi:hypothetical protein ACWDE9_40765, partial [Streptomyces olivaceoviridis]